jgi:3-hydroxyisobutyrate dehydrogenase-like beta-hydroxyacid dehydrogenase
MKKIGFIGLGTMGKPMAMNLLKAGNEMYVYDINSDVKKEFQSLAAKTPNRICDIAKAADVVITMLPDSPEVEQVYLGGDGLISGARPGLIFIDCSTIDPETTKRIGLEVSQAGGRMLDAPVGGGRLNAQDGTLIMLVGGDKSVMESCQSILETMGRTIIYCGSLGSGESLKIINNLMTMIFNFLLMEGYTLAEKSGVDQDKLLDLQKMNVPRLLETITKNIRTGFLKEGFKTVLGHKDLKLAIRMGQGYGVPLPFGSLAMQMFQFAITQGFGQLNTLSPLFFYQKKE